MICFNKENDYAIRILYCLSGSEKRMDAATISEKTGITLRFSLKILGQLVKSQLVKSFKGATGGYVLALPSEKITLYDAVIAISGDIKINNCLNDEYICSNPNSENCPFCSVFREINETIIAKLKSVTFAANN